MGSKSKSTTTPSTTTPTSSSPSTIPTLTVTEKVASVDAKEDPRSATNQKSKATLFLRNIPFDASKEQLEEFFSTVGPIKNCFLITNEKKESKGIGFVQFSIATDALKAIDELKAKKFLSKRVIKMELANKRAPNGKDSDELAGETKPMNEVEGGEKEESTVKEVTAKVPTAKPVEKKYLNKSQEKVTLLANRKPKLIIRNLTFTTTADDLTKLFEQFGDILEVKVPLKQNGNPTGFGFIEFTDVKAAEQALEKINGNQFDGRTIAVDWSVPKDKFEKDAKAAVDAKKNAKEAVVAKDAKKIEKDTKVEEAKKDPKSKKDKKVKEIVVESEKEDEEEDEDEFEMVDVDVSTSDEDTADESENESGDESETTTTKPEQQINPFAIGVEEQTTLFIRNLSFESVEEDLAEKFTVFGELRYAKITMDNVAGHSKGTGFVAFVNKADTTSCLEAYQKAYKVSAQFEKDQQDDASKKRRFGNSKSTLVHEPLLNGSTAQFVLDGRFLNVSLAVSKTDAGKLMTSNRVEKQHTDKRNLYLMKEGVIFADSEAAQGMTPTEISKRQASYTERKRMLGANPNLFVSKTRLSVRNLGLKVTEAALKKAAYQSVMDYWKQVENGSRENLDEDIIKDEIAAGKPKPSPKRKIIVKLAKIVRDKDRIEAATNIPRSKGYGFIEFGSHADAMCCLRVMNNNPLTFTLINNGPSKLRPIVEFSVENSQITKERDEMKRKSFEKKKFDAKNAAIIKKGHEKQAEEERIAQEKRANGQGPPRIKVVQDDYFVKKPASVKRGAGVTAKQVAPAPKKQKTEKKKDAKVEKLAEKSVEIVEKIAAVPVVKVAKTLSKNQKRELQKEAQFDSLVNKYKSMIDIQ